MVQDALTPFFSPLLLSHSSPLLRFRSSVLSSSTSPSSATARQAASNSTAGTGNAPCPALDAVAVAHDAGSGSGGDGGETSGGEGGWKSGEEEQWNEARDVQNLAQLSPLSLRRTRYKRPQFHMDDGRGGLQMGGARRQQSERFSVTDSLAAFCQLWGNTSRAGGYLVMTMDGVEAAVFNERPGQPLEPPPDASLPVHLTWCSQPLYGTLDAGMVWTWAEYHRVHANVSRFIFYDMAAWTPALTALFTPYFAAGVAAVTDMSAGRRFGFRAGVELLYFTTKHQTLASNDCIYRSLLTSRWVILHDTDEFLAPVPPHSLPSLLATHAHAPWLSHGAFAVEPSVCQGEGGEDAPAPAEAATVVPADSGGVVGGGSAAVEAAGGGARGAGAAVNARSRHAETALGTAGNGTEGAEMQWDEAAGTEAKRRAVQLLSRMVFRHPDVWCLRDRAEGQRIDSELCEDWRGHRKLIVNPRKVRRPLTLLAGAAWCCVVLRGAAWCCVVLRGAAWCCVVLRGAAWCCVVLCGAAWCCVVLRGAALCCVVLRGAAWCCVVLRCAAWCCVVLRGAAWCCVVLRGAALCCVVLRGAAWCCVVLRCAALCCVALNGGGYVYPHRTGATEGRSSAERSNGATAFPFDEWNRTYYPKEANHLNVEKQWYIVDATDKRLGRLASTIANHIRGKDQPTYTPSVDMGAYVIVMSVNAEKVAVTGKKRAQKIYRQHSGRPGGMTEETFHQVQARIPERIVEHAVRGMLPKGRAGSGNGGDGGEARDRDDGVGGEKRGEEEQQNEAPDDVQTPAQLSVSDEALSDNTVWRIVRLQYGVWRIVRYAVWRIVRYAVWRIVRYAVWRIVRYAVWRIVRYAVWRIVRYAVWRIVRYAVWRIVRYAVWRIVRYAVWRIVRYAVWRIVRYAVWRIVRYAVWRIVRYAVWRIVRYAVWRIVRYAVWGIVRAYRISPSRFVVLDGLNNENIHPRVPSPFLYTRFRSSPLQTDSLAAFCQLWGNTSRAGGYLVMTMDGVEAAVFNEQPGQAAVFNEGPGETRFEAGEMRGSLEPPPDASLPVHLTWCSQPLYGTLDAGPPLEPPPDASLPVHLTWCSQPLYGTLDAGPVWAWPEYHRVHANVSRFLFYDMAAWSPALSALFAPYFAAGIAAVTDMSGGQRFGFHAGEGALSFITKHQTLAGNDCIFRSLLTSRWVTLHDTDEFLSPVPPHSLHSLLATHAHAPWLSHGALVVEPSMCQEEREGALAPAGAAAVAPADAAAVAAGGGTREAGAAVNASNSHEETAPGTAGNGMQGGEAQWDEAAVAEAKRRAIEVLSRLVFRRPEVWCVRDRAEGQQIDSNLCDDWRGHRKLILNPRKVTRPALSGFLLPPRRLIFSLPDASLWFTFSPQWSRTADGWGPEPQKGGVVPNTSSPISHPLASHPHSPSQTETEVMSIHKAREPEKGSVTEVMSIHKAREPEKGGVVLNAGTELRHFHLPGVVNPVNVHCQTLVPPGEDHVWFVRDTTIADQLRLLANASALQPLP
ncbi:unnamed protein product [Closterium sp. Naga37s-1]|nr:unnamed protein product [Closterium sp. Naga37s-1]